MIARAGTRIETTVGEAVVVVAISFGLFIWWSTLAVLEGFRRGAVLRP